MRNELGVDREMTISTALWIVCMVHTRDDHQVGFVIEEGSNPGLIGLAVSYKDYVEAWRIVRRAAGMQIDPQKGE